MEYPLAQCYTPTVSHLVFHVLLFFSKDNRCLKCSQVGDIDAGLALGSILALVCLVLVARKYEPVLAELVNGS